MVEKNPDLPLLDAIEPIIISNNRFYCSHGWDIDLDDGSTNFRIYNNVCLNGGLKLREGYNRIVENNIIVNNTFHPHVWYKNSGDIFKHNIVTSDYAPIGICYWGKEVDSNFFLQKTSLQSSQSNGTDSHSIFGDPQFVNAAIGNYNVKLFSKALSIGFKNFPVNNFGVVSPSLKKKAAKPIISEIKILQSAKKGQTTEWLGATIKDVETLGEQSVAGLPDISGVIILKVSAGSLAEKSGLQQGDVIRKIDEKNILNTAQMLMLLKVSSWLSELRATITRNQQENEIVLFLK